MLLVALLITAGSISIVEFFRLSRSVSSILEDNYKTIEASKKMLEALERMDSGVLLLLMGQAEEGHEIISSASKLYSDALLVAQHNITEPNEGELITSIDSLYIIFANGVAKSIANKNQTGNISWYQNEVYSPFLKVKQSVKELVGLNQNSMYTEANLLKEKAHRAIMPGIVAIVGGIVFSIILSFFISKYYIAPLSELAEAIRTYHPSEKQLRSSIKSDDEIKRIEESVNNLINRLLKRNKEQ